MQLVHQHPDRSRTPACAVAHRLRVFIILTLSSCSAGGGSTPGRLGVYRGTTAGVSGASNAASGESAGVDSAAMLPMPPLTAATPMSIAAGSGAAGAAANAAQGRQSAPPMSMPIPPPMPMSIDKTGADNPAGLSAAEVTKLIAGGPLGDMKWLYPYDDTVFPRGMLAPLVMWNGDPDADAVYLHIKSALFEYKGVLKPTDDGLILPASYAESANQALSMLGTPATGKQLRIPQDVWELAGQQTLGGGDTFTLELSERANGTVRGLISSRIRIAQADIKGSIFYSTCFTKLQQSDFVGALLVSYG